MSKPPSSLREIFKISNRNRKQNKHKKKVGYRFEADFMSTNSSIESHNLENASQIIAAQYKQD